MSSPVIHPSVQRDLSLQRLRDLTFGVGAGAAALLGLFSIVAAATVPGHSDSGATANATTASDSSRPSDSQSQDDVNTTGGGVFQLPAPGSVTQAGSALPIAVSGGSR